MDEHEPRRIRLSRLLFLDNMPAGMDWAVIGMHVCKLRKTAAPCEPPIKVRPIAGTAFYRVTDGRHRCVAAMIAGRAEIEYVLVLDQEPGPGPEVTLTHGDLRP